MVKCHPCWLITRYSWRWTWHYAGLWAQTACGPWGWPKFCKARPVTYAMHGKLKGELQIETCTKRNSGTHTVCWLGSSHCASTVKGLGYFNHILVISVAFLLCAWHECKVQGILTIWKSAVEKLPSFVKLVDLSPFRNKHFWWGLLFLSLILHICPWNVPWLHGFSSNATNVAKQIFWKKRRANVTNEKAPRWTFKKT